MDSVTNAADKTKDVNPADSKGFKGFIVGLVAGFKQIVKGAAWILGGAVVLALVGAILAGGFLLILKILQDADPKIMLAFSVSVGILGATLALLGKTKGSLLQGALALAVIAIAMYPFAMAMQMLIGLKMDEILAAGAGMLLFAGIVIGLGAIMGTGIGAGLIALGAAALVILGLAMYSFADKLSYLSKQKEGLAALKDMATLATNVSGLRAVGEGLNMITEALGKMSNTTPPILDKLIQLAATAPSFEKIGNALSGIGGGGGEKKEDKLDKLISAVETLATNILNKKGDVTIDGKKIGAVLAPIIGKEINYTTR